MKENKWKGRQLAIRYYEVWIKGKVWRGPNLGVLERKHKIYLTCQLDVA